MGTIAASRTKVLTRLGDVAQQVWTAAEVDLHLDTAYRLLANLRVFPDRLYVEPRTASFSYTAAFELLDGWVVFNAGRAMFTYEAERDELTGSSASVGPASITAPWIATDGWPGTFATSAPLPATADLPASVVEVDRATWDNRAIDAVLPGDLAGRDTRYQITAGEVYGYLWRQDGVRTLRLVRVPARQAGAYTVTGSWGALRRPTDLSTATVTGTWGVPRQIPGQHPMGSEGFGAPRRAFQETTSVRVEHWRTGRDWRDGVSACELPPRYEAYLRDYALWKCYSRVGPGQDVALAGLFQQRWGRGLARVKARLEKLQAARTGILGGAPRTALRRPPRPSMPWPYGAQR